MRGPFRVLIIAACLGIAALRPSLAATPQPVSISLQAELSGSKLYISGHASVPDGAWIIYGIYRRRKPELHVTGYARVRRQSFSARIDVGDWPSGKITVDANFQILLPKRHQPQAVVALYGAQGQRMTGPEVVRGGASFRAAVASTAVVKP